MRQRLAVEDPVEITAVRVSTDAAPAGTAVLRLIGMLPAHWDCGQRIEEDRITVLVRGGVRDARERCAEALRDRALEGWVLEGSG
ncbi:hypothetical protein RI138_14515 [Streptomyces sp. C11-1]|uniref:Uncharacterized protein n=1 Tax=Streptomyces durocortorensis TaxID=2811104 RepID=A0ABY9VW59_9ACTN|nr:hypothetical protein [Streptomyces durocortorensis]WNF27943.1 hypothetical protein RI138_14515 [Streptomyces durocortorensis]